MRENINNVHKTKYGMFSNLVFLYKEEMRVYPKTRWLIPINIITEITLPFIGISIPAFAVSIITNKKGGGYFTAIMGMMLLLYTIINCLNKHSTMWMNQINARLRCDEFMKKLVLKSITTDYNNVETQKQHKLIEKASAALMSNWVGVEIMYKRTPTVIVNLIGILGYGTAIFVLDIRILIIIICMSIVSLKLNDYAKNYMDKNRDKEAELNRTISYLYSKSITLENGKDVRIYQMEAWFKDVFYDVIKKIVKLNLCVEKRWYLPVASDTIFASLRDFVAYIILINGVLDGRITIAVFTLYIGIIGGFSKWIIEFIKAYSELKKGSIQVDDYRYLIEFPDKFKRKDGLAIPSKDRYPLTIEFKDVSFRYDGADKDTLSHINLTIKGGESVALVGHNGAGKSTLVKLLCGFYHPTCGEIIVGGHSISDYDIDEYYRLIGAVFQDIKPVAFNIAQNVSASDMNETDMEKVKESLKAAGLYEKINSLKNKEMTYISQVFSQEGIQLSGGETQKLMLARAIYKNAPIMILDESTSALDPIAESSMYEEYNKLTKDKTSLFISHRLASTRFCDKIVFLENGIILEEGTHEELIDKGKKYAQVYEIQSHYYKENSNSNKIEFNEGYAV